MKARVASAAILQSPTYNKPVLIQAGAHLLDGGNVQRVIGALTRHNLRRNRHPQGVQGRHHHLQLGQIRPMVFAMPKLKQPVFRHAPVTAGRGAIQPHPVRLQIIHAEGAPVEIGFKRLPLLGIGQFVQHDPQAIVAPLLRPDGLPRAEAYRVRALFHPRLNLVQPVIAFRSDVGQPHQAGPAQTGALPVAMGFEMPVQKFGNPDFLALPQQDRDIVHLFRRYLDCIGHADSLLHFVKSTKNARTMSCDSG
jgi:hypothetical protein